MPTKGGYSGGRTGGGGVAPATKYPETFAGRGKALERALQKLGNVKVVKVLDNNNVIVLKGRQEYQIRLADIGNNTEVGSILPMGEISLTNERGAIIATPRTPGG